jgi:hypothetical protein
MFNIRYKEDLLVYRFAWGRNPTSPDPTELRSQCGSAEINKVGLLLQQVPAE